MTKIAEGAQGESRRGSSRLLDLLAGFVFLSLGLGVVLQPYVTMHKMPGDLGDASFNLSLLEFFYRTLSDLLQGKLADFVDAPFYYPWPRVTNFSDTHWGDAEVYALFRALGMNLITAFQAWLIAAFGLTYLSTFVSLRMLSLRAFGAAVGAFVFTFCLPMMAQVGHAQLIYRLWIPPAVLVLHRCLTRQSLRAGSACMLFLGLQLAVSIYLGLFLSLLLAGYAAALWLFARNLLPPRLWPCFSRADAAEFIGAGFLLVVALLVLAVVLIPYYKVQSMYGFSRSWGEIEAILPRPGSYLLAGASRLWPNLSAEFNYPPWPNEHQIFPGLSVILPLVYFGFSKQARKRQPLAAPMLAVTAMVFIATIDMSGYSLYWLLYQIPGFDAVRAVTRIILVLMLPLAALLGMMIDDLTRTPPTLVPHRLIATALALFVVGECSLVHLYSSSPSDWRARMDTLDARLPRQLPANAILAIASYPGWPGLLQTQTDAELAAARLGIVTVNGYSGSNPPKWKPMNTCHVLDDNLRAAKRFLAEQGAGVPDFAQDRFVLLGFNACDPVPPHEEPPLQFGHVYHFMQGADGNQFLGDGFSDPESWGRWTEGKRAFVFFSLPTAPLTSVTISIEAKSLSSATGGEQRVEISANGQPCGLLIVTESQPRTAVTCPAGSLLGKSNMLRFAIAHPTRPIDIGLNADHRLLGLGLINMTLTPMEKP
jgi:hypothetical protein